MNKKRYQKNLYLFLFFPVLFFADLLFSNCPQPDDKIEQPHIDISSSEDMQKIGTAKSHPLYGIYTLVNDITLENWLPIGNEAAPFTGIFDGNGSTIHLNSFSGVALSSQNYLGIFGYVKGDAAFEKTGIKNLTIVSAVEAKGFPASAQAIGLVAAYAECALIEHITISGSLTFESGKTILLGGIAGLLNQPETILRNSSSSLTMNIIPGSGSGLAGYNYIGGIVGMFKNGAGIENCHTTGDLIADNTLNDVSGQVFAGGIAGGSFYTMGTKYQGYIADSSSTGIITGRAGGNWTFAGGIAGTIAGGTVNSEKNTTRIVRCFSAGKVSVEGTKSAYPHAGGITGYLYFGALVSQSCFSGAVIADKATDYTGGIAGYISQATAPNNSRIEDCWTGGTITGFNNAGGIAGQAQINTFVRRNYSVAAVSAANSAGAFGVGGIAGSGYSALSGAISANVALNPSLAAPMGDAINRITGITGGNISGNYAWSGMIINPGTGTYTPETGAALAGGATIDTQTPEQSFYESLGWDFITVWKMGSNGLPQLQWQ